MSNIIIKYLEFRKFLTYFVYLYRELDLGLYECVASLIWVASRLESECAELRVISECLASKYGKEFALMCKANSNNKVNERLMMKMSEQAPGELLVEKYLVEIAKSHNVPFKPNPDIAIRDPEFFFERNSNDKNRRNGGGGGASEVDDVSLGLGYFIFI